MLGYDDSFANRFSTRFRDAKWLLYQTGVASGLQNTAYIPIEPNLLLELHKLYKPYELYKLNSA